MPTRNVVLTDQQTEFIKQLVSSGRYQNASEVLREDLVAWIIPKDVLLLSVSTLGVV